MMKTLLFLALSLCASLALAQQKKAPQKDHVLDFEGEVIEGERQRPDLFLQITNKDVNNGDLIYLRDNFNDFTVVDRGLRPQYYRVKK